MKAHTKESQAAMTPETSLQALKDGNERFITATQVVRDLNAQVEATSTGQYPFATVSLVIILLFISRILHISADLCPELSELSCSALLLHKLFCKENPQWAYSHLFL